MLAEAPFFLHLWTYVRSCSKHVHVVHADPVLIGVLGHIDSSKNHEEPVLGESFGKCVSVCISCLICRKTQRCAFGPPLPNHHSQMNQFAHRVITPSMVRCLAIKQHPFSSLNDHAIQILSLSPDRWSNKDLRLWAPAQLISVQLETSSSVSLPHFVYLAS
jgi:hypothetical protein